MKTRVERVTLAVGQLTTYALSPMHIKWHSNVEMIYSRDEGREVLVCNWYGEEGEAKTGRTDSNKNLTLKVYPHCLETSQLVTLLYLPPEEGWWPYHYQILSNLLCFTLTPDLPPDSFVVVRRLIATITCDGFSRFLSISWFYSRLTHTLTHTQPEEVLHNSASNSPVIDQLSLHTHAGTHNTVLFTN